VTGLALSLPELRKALSRHRALLAAGLAAGSVATALGVLAPHARAGVAVIVATRDLPAGTALAAADVRSAELPAGMVPGGALTAAHQATGRLLAAPVRRGETLLDVRLAGPQLLAGLPGGLLAVPVRVADGASVALLSAGDRVDVLAAGTAAGGPAYATVVAVDAAVLAVPTAVDAGGEGALVVLATTPSVAARLASAAVSSRLSITLRPPR
jgi:Flp pilus assembly protein CpaB